MGAGIRPIPVTLGILCALAGFAVSDARAAWIEPVGISTEGLQAREPQIDIDGVGNVTVAWVSGSSPNQAIFVAERPVGGSWKPPAERIAAANDCHDPVLEVNPAGAAVVVADCKTGATAMRAASRTANGTWGTSIEIPGSGSGKEPRVALDDAGNAVAVWAAESSTVQSSYKPVAGSWDAAPLQVSPVGDVALEPDVAISPTGRALAVWMRDRAPDPVVTVETQSRQGSGPWNGGLKVLTTPITLTTPVAVTGSGGPQVTMNSGGRIAVWPQLVSGLAVLRNAWGSGSDFGVWGEDAALHQASDGVYAVEAPQVALDAQGRAVAVWRAYKNPPGVFGVQAATTGFINGPWSPPTTLVESGGNSSTQPTVVMDPAGDALIAWEIGGTVTAVSRPAGTALAGPGVPISNLAHPGFLPPQIAMDVDGDGVVTWSSPDSLSTHIAVRVNDVTPPVLSAIVTPSSVEAGAGAPMSASATDTWTATTISWDFGDGASATGGAVSHTYAAAGARTVTVTATDAVGNSTSQTRTISVTPRPGEKGGGQGQGSKVALTAKVVKQPWKKIQKARAIKLRCKLDVAGTCSVKATVSAAVARRLGLKVARRARALKVGQGSAKVAAGKFKVVRVVLTPISRTGIDAATKPVPISLAVTGTASGREPATLSRKLKVRRP
ncbi:MAG: PKD domain-containing protein [Solirubrobacterales bacterium]